MRVRALVLCLSVTACASTAPSDPPSPREVPASEPVATEDPAADADRPAPANSTDASDSTDCAAMPRTTCMRSTACTLEHVGPDPSHSYRCRPSVSACEVGFAQAGFFGSGDDIPASERQQAACNERPGCTFAPGGCYCHCRGTGETSVPDGEEAEHCRCECSGGPPPSCLPSP